MASIRGDLSVLAERMGLVGAKLKAWLDEQEARAQDERAAEREARKESLQLEAIREKNLQLQLIYLLSKCGGLGIIQLHRVAQSVHFKSLVRLLRLGSSFVDSLFDCVLHRNYSGLSHVFRIPPGITAPADVTAALQRGFNHWWTNLKAR